MTEDEFEHDDAAYVLGALSVRDRERFEAHLQDCDDCVARVAELWRLRDLLALAPESAFRSGGAGPAAGPAPVPQVAAAPSGEPPDSLLPRLQRSIRTERRRRRLTGSLALTGLVAAAAAVVALVLVTHDDTSYKAPAQAVALVNVGDVPLRAKVQIVDHDDWAQVNLWCTYESQTYREGNYQAVAHSRTGKSAVVGVWPGLPGQTAIIRTPTQFRSGEITSIEIQTASGKTLSRLEE